MAALSFFAAAIISSMRDKKFWQNYNGSKMQHFDWFSSAKKKCVFCVYQLVQKELIGSKILPDREILLD